MHIQLPSSFIPRFLRNLTAFFFLAGLASESESLSSFREAHQGHIKDETSEDSPRLCLDCSLRDLIVVSLRSVSVLLWDGETMQSRYKRRSSCTKMVVTCSIQCLHLGFHCRYIHFIV